METAQTTVPLVEDDPNDVARIRLAFQEASLPVALQLVCDGDEAVDYLSGRRVYADRHTYPLPGLVLLDVKLPRRSGIQVLAWIRRQPLSRLSWRGLRSLDQSIAALSEGSTTSASGGG